MLSLCLFVVKALLPAPPPLGNVRSGLVLVQVINMLLNHKMIPGSHHLPLPVTAGPEDAVFYALLELLMRVVKLLLSLGSTTHESLPRYWSVGAAVEVSCASRAKERGTGDRVPRQRRG